MTIGFKTTIQEVNLDFTHKATIEGLDYSKLYNITPQKCIINWQIRPVVNSSGIMSFGFSLLTGSTLDVIYSGHRVDRSQFEGRDEDGDEVFGDEDFEEEATIKLETDDYKVEFEVEEWSSKGSDFTIRIAFIDFDTKTITLVI